MAKPLNRERFGAALLVASIFVVPSAFADDGGLAGQISHSETIMFGHPTSGVSAQARVEALESNVFGKPSKGPLDKRLQKINKILGIGSPPVANEGHSPQSQAKPEGARLTDAGAVSSQNSSSQAQTSSAPTNQSVSSSAPTNQSASSSAPPNQTASSSAPPNQSVSSSASTNQSMTSSSNAGTPHGDLAETKSAKDGTLDDNVLQGKTDQLGASTNSVDNSLSQVKSEPTGESAHQAQMGSSQAKTAKTGASKGSIGALQAKTDQAGAAASHVKSSSLQAMSEPAAERAHQTQTSSLPSKSAQFRDTAHKAQLGSMQAQSKQQSKSAKAVTDKAQQILLKPMTAQTDMPVVAPDRKGSAVAPPLAPKVVFNAKQMLQLGTKRFAEGNTREADQVFRQVLAHDPNNVDALFNLGAISERRGDFVSALGLYRTALTLKPKDRDLKQAVEAVEKQLSVEVPQEKASLGSAATSVSSGTNPVGPFRMPAPSNGQPLVGGVFDNQAQASNQFTGTPMQASMGQPPLVGTVVGQGVGQANVTPPPIGLANVTQPKRNNSGGIRRALIYGTSMGLGLVPGVGQFHCPICEVLFNH